MSRHKFLGSTDISTKCSLLNTYNVPTKIPDCVELHQIKQQDDLVLIELGTLLTTDECDQILKKIAKNFKFEKMSNKYDKEMRNNSRLVIMDDRLGRTLWRRLRFSHGLHKLIQNTKPLGFNVQGEWELSDVNPAMRINKYTKDHFFAPHKDAQYAPSGDERSLFSLIIYLNDDYQEGETKFYFPKIQSKSDIKGLTIKEEIQAYGGLENGYECVVIKPKKGHAVLFTHHLLHEATSPETEQSTERIVLRSDVLVERKGKPLGFAVRAEEEEDYLACLNFFRQAQQCELESHKDPDQLIAIGELYERSLSIRYCYPRLLEQKLCQSMDIDDEQKPLVDQLPPETWLHVFRFLNEQDVQNLVFAYPQFQLLQIAWDVQEKRHVANDLTKEKFIPSVETQYGSRTLFRFHDAEFFDRHISQCCRVAAVYAFFLLANARDSTTYTVRYNRMTHEVCEVEVDKLLSDTFYNRNCYGSLYRVQQKDETKRQPEVDLDNSVDRTYMSNRHQSQFIGQDLFRRFHFAVKLATEVGSDEGENDDDSWIPFRKGRIRKCQRTRFYYNRELQLIDPDHYDSLENMPHFAEDNKAGFSERLIEQIDRKSGSSICRILSAQEHMIENICSCSYNNLTYDMTKMEELVHVYNHLVFDFDTHQLTVEPLSDERIGPFPSWLRNYGPEEFSGDNPLRYYRVNIEKLAQVSRGFNHASCDCIIPTLKVDQFIFQDYTYLRYVDLAVAQDTAGILVLARYDGIVAL